MTNIIEEIKKERVALIPEEYKNAILDNIKMQLKYSEIARIDGASHYPNRGWNFPSNSYCYAPFKYHAAISEWLQTLGFGTSRYYNKGGIDNGLKVWIN